jgi:(p)ppGpp synthase/HD superfamily hydrolase
MQYAKSRSTRAKLRSYFRAKQRENLQEAGGILLHDFLTVHEDLIAAQTFLNQPPPRTLQELEAFLPGECRYDNLDDLLMEIGKRHDRQFLRNIVSKVLRVPLSSLEEAERKNGYKARLISENIFAAVRDSRKKAKDAGSVIDLEGKQANDVLSDVNSADTISSAATSNRRPVDLDKAFGSPTSTTLFADAEHLCEDCLPVKRDDIIGTKAVDLGYSGEESPTTVHRTACLHAQRAINRSRAHGGNSSFGVPSSQINAREVDVVNLVWADLKDDEDMTYMAEVEVVASDRKLLLADCSEIVSEIAFILKTGSATSNEHATLNFLVKVRDLPHLQHLMDGLRSVPSVMSVERKVSKKC